MPVALYVAILWQDFVDIFDSSLFHHYEAEFFHHHEAAPTTSPVDASPLLVVLGLYALFWIVMILVTAAISLANVHVGVSMAVGAPARIGGALRFGLRRMLPFVGWLMLTAPIGLAALCLFYFPVFYVMAVFTVLPVVVAVERTNAIGRCFELFHRNLKVSLSRIGTIFGVSLTVSVVVGFLSVLIIGPWISVDAGNLNWPAVVATGSVYVVVGLLMQLLLPLLVAPLSLTAYADMRARVEPVSATQIAQELGITA